MERWGASTSFPLCAKQLSTCARNAGIIKDVYFIKEILGHKAHSTMVWAVLNNIVIVHFLWIIKPASLMLPNIHALLVHDNLTFLASCARNQGSFVGATKRVCWVCMHAIFSFLFSYASVSTEDLFMFLKYSELYLLFIMRSIQFTAQIAHVGFNYIYL